MTFRSESLQFIRRFVNSVRQIPLMDPSTRAGGRDVRTEARSHMNASAQ
jgi:hypothetical protein